eukprot:580168-Rhodomonas_salina.1
MLACCWPGPPRCWLTSVLWKYEASAAYMSALICRRLYVGARFAGGCRVSRGGAAGSTRGAR